MSSRYRFFCSLVLCLCCVAMAASEKDPITSEIDELIDLCPPTQLVLGGIVKNCENALDDYFLDKPAWKFIEFIYDVSKFGKLAFRSEVYGPTRLRIKELDQPVLPQLPTWRNIFEEEIDDLDIIASQVFKDETCRDLLTGPVRPELTERCSAKELFQYATQLDMCLTGLEQYDWLLQRRTFDSGITLYESELESYSEMPSDEPRAWVTELKEGTLNSVWLAQRCAQLSVSAFDADLNGSIRTLEPLAYEQLATELKNGHDTALSISARAGYLWSLFSYEPPMVVDDVEYWKSLFHVEPYLVHYWLAIGVSDFHLQQKMLHGFKTYTMKFKEPSMESLEPFVSEFIIPIDKRRNRFSFPIVKLVIEENPNIDLDQASSTPSTLDEDSRLPGIFTNPLQSFPSQTDVTRQIFSAESIDLIDSQLEYPW